jgi:hypothetical protein
MMKASVSRYCRRQISRFSPLTGLVSVGGYGPLREHFIILSHHARKIGKPQRDRRQSPQMKANSFKVLSQTVGLSTRPITRIAAAVHGAYDKSAGSIRPTPIVYLFHPTYLSRSSILSSYELVLRTEVI